MNNHNVNRFQDLFNENKYTTLKNHLYNYHLRKKAVEKNLQNENIKLILEIGSGISLYQRYSSLNIHMEKDIMSSQTA